MFVLIYSSVFRFKLNLIVDSGITKKSIHLQKPRLSFYSIFYRLEHWEKFYGSMHEFSPLRIPLNQQIR